MKIADYRNLIKKDRKPRQDLEFIEQCKVVNYLEELILKGAKIKYTAIPNNTWTPSWNQKKKNKQAGLNPGFPDLIILNKKKALCIEMKVGKNEPTEQQAEWHEALNKAGIDTRVAWGFEGAKEIIDNFL